MIFGPLRSIKGVYHAIVPRQVRLFWKYQREWPVRMAPVRWGSARGVFLRQLPMSDLHVCSLHCVIYHCCCWIRLALELNKRLVYLTFSSEYKSHEIPMEMPFKSYEIMKSAWNSPWNSIQKPMNISLKSHLSLMSSSLNPHGNPMKIPDGNPMDIGNPAAEAWPSWSKAMAPSEPRSPTSRTWHSRRCRACWGRGA